MRAIRIFFLMGLLLVNFLLATYHNGVIPKPVIPVAAEGSTSNWIPKSEIGINQLILAGDPYSRGVRAGVLTRHLLEQQENELVTRLESIIPSRILLQAFVIFSINWFQGIEKYFEDWTLQEMYGVSQSAPEKYNYLADGFTRQVAYHGLHEVGQMMIDQSVDGFGCTVVALPFGKKWIMGRNFDFEGGRIFDTEKIMKWVFPEKGHAYLSVIWAGMVGAVTGINDQGLYISLNAAGSDDVRRVGTPTTLVLLKVLQFASNTEEALAILKEAQTFITDVFVVLDSKSNRLFRVEKSPVRTQILEIHQPDIIANHLVDPVWSDDKVNTRRKVELTSGAREERGKALLKAWIHSEPRVSEAVVRDVLSILRDKGEADGAPLHLGNRRAIDALIATHSLIFDSVKNVVYVGRGPGVSGEFVGFDLKASFLQKTPVAISGLPRDPLVSDEIFHAVRLSEKQIQQAKQLIRHQQCDLADQVLNEAAKEYKEQSSYYEVLGDLYACRNEKEQAREAWRKSLDLHPAYEKTIRALKEKVAQ